MPLLSLSKKMPKLVFPLAEDSESQGACLPPASIPPSWGRRWESRLSPSSRGGLSPKQGAPLCPGGM